MNIKSARKRLGNPQISGMSLLGFVEGCAGETVRLKLDIDSSWADSWACSGSRLIQAGAAGASGAAVGKATLLTGVLYVGEQAVSDIIGGRVSDTEKYVRKALAGSAVGFGEIWKINEKFLDIQTSSGLLMKEVFGMRLDSVFYNNIITIFDSSMDRIFGTDIKKTEAVCRFENRGYFRLEYEYFPNHYKIVVENELRTFDITILDDEQAFRSLYGITEFNNGLSKEGIENAISLLKTVLEKNDFAMYFHKDGKMYRRSSEGIKRIKHIEDILNG